MSAERPSGQPDLRIPRPPLVAREQLTGIHIPRPPMNIAEARGITIPLPPLGSEAHTPVFNIRDIAKKMARPATRVAAAGMVGSAAVFGVFHTPVDVAASTIPNTGEFRGKDKNDTKPDDNHSGHPQPDKTPTKKPEPTKAKATDTPLLSP